MTDQNGYQTRYSYELPAASPNRHALTAIAYADGSHRYFSYNAAGRIKATWRDGNKERVVYGYDSYGAVTATDLAGGVSRTWLDHFGGVAKTVSADGQVAVARFDELHRLVGVTDGENQHEDYTVACCGVLTSVTDRNGHTERFDYAGPARHMTRSVDGKGNATHYTFSAANDPRRSSNRMGQDFARLRHGGPAHVGHESSRAGDRVRARCAGPD